MQSRVRIRSARIQSDHQIDVLLTPHSKPFFQKQFTVPGVTILNCQREGDCYHLTTEPIVLKFPFMIQVETVGETEMIADGIFNQFVSNKQLGCSVEGEETVFRLFAPQAERVQLVRFERWQDKSGPLYDLAKDADGVWDLRLPGNFEGQYYVYRLNGRHPASDAVFSDLDIADPYSRSVIRLNHYTYPSKTHILNDHSFDWEDDRWVCPKLEDLIIYELHVRDMTLHDSSGVPDEKRGTYLGLVHPKTRGGIDYIRALGVNAVELLPVHEFANLEVPYRDWRVPVWNTWNPYARNHWGYMTSFFFTPESYYATGGHLRPNETDGGLVEILTEFKTMVKAFHKAGITVILDVVYNHASQYDLNPLRQIDREYYFRLDDDGKYQNKSFCGNDLYTERPMLRRLIADSLVYWMTEFHVDGFRFDLAGLLDDDTVNAISVKTRAINPDVILIAEPWGGDRYGQQRFSERGWGAWNDQFRNGVKGRDPVHNSGFIFGQQSDGKKSIDAIKLFLQGTLQKDGGPFVKPGHSVNYLESHDEWTFGDFVRIASGEVSVNTVIQDIQRHVRLTPRREKLHRLGALILLVSRGAVMIHAGQEFARSQVIAQTDAPDPDVGRMDPNSYNKDNATNWIDYTHAEVNQDLVVYYRGLIKLRKAFPQLRYAEQDTIQFLSGTNPFSLGYFVQPPAKTKRASLLILLNGHPTDPSRFHLPEGKWSLLVSESKAGVESLQKGITGELEVVPTSGVVLVEEV